MTYNTLILNWKVNFNLINKNNDTLPNEEVQDILNESNAKILLHKDMCEDFYNENKAFYEDMSLRLTKHK